MIFSLRWLVVLLVVIPAVVGPADVSYASCAGEPRDLVQQAPVVAVVTVVRTEGDHAVVQVEEVWRGPDLPPMARLGTSPTAGQWWPPRFLAGASSVDADVKSGIRYIVATEGDRFRTNDCLVLEATPDAIEDLAPATSRPPVPGAKLGGESDGVAGAAILFAVTVAVAVSGVFVAVRRRQDR